MKELGIYVHIPFCRQKCYYCDFISFKGKEDKIENYIKALNCEIKYEKENKEEYKVTTIYIGGGTPSFINSKHIKIIIKNIKENYNVDESAEITLELNPGTIDKEKLEDYKEAGINRLSIGLQTTNNELLKEIGRIHNYEEFLNCYNLIRKVGFKNVNIDLMEGLPNQTTNDIQETLNKIIELNPEHISLYSLIIEENTLLEKFIKEGKVKLPDEDLERQMYWKAKKTLEENGYIQYEISNFSKKGYESKHNTNCWKQKEYLGFGIAAHSYYENTRYCNLNNIEKYIENIENNKIKENRVICEIQKEEDKKKEYMLLGLRMIEGVSIQEFKNKFIDNPIYVYRKELEKLVKKDLLQIDLNNIKLTNKGIDFANMVWEEFV